MRLIGNGALVITAMVYCCCVGGSVSFKKNRIYVKEDVCNPWSGKHDRYLKYKDYSVFSVSNQEIDTTLRIYWDEWNIWYLLLIIAPIPTYGFWKEASPATLNFEIVNRRKSKITLDVCEIRFSAYNEKEQSLKPIPQCEEMAPISIEVNGRKNFSLRYISTEMKKATQLSLTFQATVNREKITQIIEIDDAWEFCTLPING